MKCLEFILILIVVTVLLMTKMSGLQCLIDHYSKQGVCSQRKKSSLGCLVVISLKIQFVLLVGLKNSLHRLDENVLCGGY